MINNNSKKGIGTHITIAIIVLALVVSGVFYFAIRQKSQKATNPQEKALMEKEGGAMKILAGTSAPLIDFNKVDYDEALKSDKLIVLYFYANWCPICKEELPNGLYPAFNQLTTDKVIGFRVNYNDSQTDNDEENLARDFGVAYQHTKVFLKNGQRVLKSPESWDKDRYLSEINKILAQ